MFVILTPHLKNPTNIQWRGKLSELKGNIEIFEDAVKNSNKEQTLKDQFLNLSGIYLNFIKTCLEKGTFTLEAFFEFTAKAFEIIKINMANATYAQAKAILPAMLKWKKLLGPEEWRKVHVLIPTVWPVALNSPRLQLFERIIDQDKIHTNIITSEFPRSFEEGRDLVGRVVGDRSVGRFVFGTADTKAKMKVLALSSRTDVVADDFEIAFDKIVSELPPEDASLVNSKGSSQSTPINGCPLNFTQATTPSKSSSSTGLIIKQTRMLDKDGLWDISISPCGRVSKIEQAASSPSILESNLSNNQLEVIDASGKFTLPGLVDGHIHLDKCYLLDRCSAVKGDFTEAQSETLNAKKAFTVEDIRARARKLIEKEISFGTTLLRAHVEVDPILGFKAVEAILPLCQEYSWAITIQVLFF